MTLLCVPIFLQDLAESQRDIALAAEAGADIVELRLDRLTHGVALPNYPVPVIVTCRPEWEGGESTLSDGFRITLLEAFEEDGDAQEGHLVPSPPWGRGLG